MALSFPYPLVTDKPRSVGQGCVGCVHWSYCPALYWMRRYGQEGRTIDNHVGIQCASWSNNMADQIKTPPTDDDLDKEYYMYLQNIQSEPDRCGITDTATGTNRR